VTARDPGGAAAVLMGKTLSVPDDTRRAALVRVSDAERDEAVAQLRQHLSEGRLDAEELADRIERALAARTRGDLDAVLGDRPVSLAPVPEGLLGGTGWTVGIMGSSVRRGRWLPRPRTNVVSLMGACSLDLRQAVLDGPELVIHAVAVMGQIDIVVPEGIEVDLSGIPVMGEKRLDMRPGPARPGAPKVVVRAVPVMGSVSVRSRPAPPAPDSRMAAQTGALGAGDRANSFASAAVDPAWDRRAAHRARRALRQQRRAARWGLLPPAGDPGASSEEDS
jgi:hypothetical protein